MMINKKGLAIAVNTVVMLIIGITIFGLGMGLFGKISGSADDQIEDLNNQIREDIASLECDGEEWVCVPSYKLNEDNSETFDMFIANHGDDKDNFEINLSLEPLTSNSFGIKKNNCGELVISYLNGAKVSIQSGYSGSLPFIVTATRVTDTPCSFITTATLTKDGDPAFEEKTSVVIRVE